ncbi:hypothetical protein BGZ94_008606 [Podila epigama]|nr:hypothetical protein BGZ94_008606 [Podila epigama]
MTSSAKITQVASIGIPFTGFQALWIPGTNRICSFGSSDAGFGVIQVHALTTGVLPAGISSQGTHHQKKQQGHQHPKLVVQSESEKKAQFKSGTFRAGGAHPPRLITGDFDGHVNIWDLNRTEVPVATINAHKDIVTCIDGAGGSNTINTSSGSLQPRQEFVTGCRDGTIKLWDTRQKEEAISVMVPKKGYGHEVWSVAMNAQSLTSDDLLVAAGYDNGDIRVLDLAAGKPLIETNIQHGVCSVEFDQRRGAATRLIATTMNGALHSFDLVNGKVTTSSTGPGSIPLKGASSEAVIEDTLTVQTGDESTLWQARHIPQRPNIFAVTDGGGNIHLSVITSKGSHHFSKEAILSLEFNDDLEGLFVACDLSSTLRVGMLKL